MQSDLSDKELQELVIELASRATDVDVRFSYVAEPKKFILNGLVPHSINALNQPWMVDWLLENRSTADIEFWHGIPLDSIVDGLRTERLWLYKSIETWKRECTKKANSLPLLLYCPSLVYSISKRPKTDMSLFRSPFSRSISHSDVYNNRVKIEGQVWKVIPVTRYAEGMSKGLYYGSERPVNSCGTFYYVEPQSSTYLAYKTELIAFNKSDACLKLGVDIGELKDEPDLLKHTNGTYRRDLMMTSEEVQRIDRSSNITGTSQRSHYAGERLYMYALEDDLDQRLCIAANELGYDVVILEAMIGRYQVVSEVLDTRRREDSFSCLLYTE